MENSEKVKLFNQWYSEYYTYLMKFLTPYVNDNSEREDVAQETFAKVYRNIEQYDESVAEVTTWICTIGINEARRYMLRKAKHNLDNWEDFTDLGEADFDAITDICTPEEELVASQTVAKVAETLSLMPGKYREAIVLQMYDGLTYEEISAKLKVPLETVRTRLRRAREFMKEFLGENYESQTSHEEATTAQYTRRAGGVR